MKEAKTFDRISDRLFQICTSSESVSSLLAKDPTLAPGDAWKKLYGHHVLKATGASEVDAAGKSELPDLKRARECGVWGPTEPSELFLRIYHDALCTLEENPLHAMVSPSLMGSCGTIPLTVISVVPDIVRHMSNLIVRAEREVFLATNFWQNAVAAKYIINGIRELNRRAGERGAKIVLKILYDRGSPKQLLEPHYIVPESEYTGSKVGLPHPSEIPNIDMQVMNYHQPMVGTFHAKYMVVDRKMAVLQSNNIQDNDNMEMMIHLEGPIVDSLYDMALISWHKKLEPPLPSHNTPATIGGLGSFGKDKAAAVNEASGGTQTPNGTFVPGALAGGGQLQSNDTQRADILTGPTTTESVTHATHPLDGAAVAQVNGTANGETADRENMNGAEDQKIVEFLAVGQQAIPEAQILEPAHPEVPLPEHTTDDPHYDVDIAGEIARVQNAVSPSANETRMQAVTRHLNHTTNVGFKGDAPDCEPGEEMTPYLPHTVHEPYPMAMVCRNPYGTPNHKSVSNPQNAAWLSALRNAKKNVFIQSPTLNAKPLVPAIVEACERGIDVFCYICLGYNDAGELLPRQGGHNDMIAHDLYQALSDAGKQRLHYFWYIAKDQTKPIIQEKKHRSCHIKLMIVDEHIGIQGNGNQDTQSWYHSQEINVMVDSSQVCRTWIDGLRRNQNTHIYGALDKKEGVWHDKEGHEAEGAIGVDPGRFSWARGVVGAIKRLQGTGGF